MTYKIVEVAKAAKSLRGKGAAALKSPELAALYDRIKMLPVADRKAFGQEVNTLRSELENAANSKQLAINSIEPIDITAPWDINTKSDQKPKTLSSGLGSMHPLKTEVEELADIFYRMGFAYEASREIDDDYHMFGSLNFPEGHPARDDWDTFMTDEGLIAPAHTSTMQNRVLKKYKANLRNNEPISVFIIDRSFRNEDLDVTHEHTFHQIEGIYVSEGTTVGNLIAVIKTFMTEYFQQEVNIKIQPFYFPFTEPSFEFAVERPEKWRKDDTEAEKWLEIGGCGMIHPNVLKEAGIDSDKYAGFAWGFGLERMVMLKHGIEDIRHFNSGKIEFMRQFS
ncbi:MAG: phenylalanine--tRNA ligase subunit alpha [Patescibacteria group bacterium]